jgi:uncharacterized DUF497 family protein
LGRCESQPHCEAWVSPEEVEQVIFNEPFDLALKQQRGEERAIQVGETDTGRILVVITTWRKGKMRVVTAFPAKRRIRKFYERQKAKGYGPESKDC